MPPIARGDDVARSVGLLAEDQVDQRHLRQIQAEVEAVGVGYDLDAALLERSLPGFARIGNEERIRPEKSSLPAPQIGKRLRELVRQSLKERTTVALGRLQAEEVGETPASAPGIERVQPGQHLHALDRQHVGVLDVAQRRAALQVEGEHVGHAEEVHLDRIGLRGQGPDQRMRAGDVAGDQPGAGQKHLQALQFARI